MVLDRVHLLSLCALALSWGLLGCGEPEPGGPGDEEPPRDPVVWPLTVGFAAERPAEVRGPEGWTGEEALPVVFVLHGFGADASLQETFVFRFTKRIETDRFLLVLPDGTKDAEGHRFWNATDSCCNFHGSDVDDVGYLMGLLDELESDYAIDSDRVYFTGHSNGGFMSFRMACEHPERIAAIMPLAGSTWLDPDDCSSGAPVSLLDVHGTEDTSVQYGGEEDHPSAPDTAARWAARAGCDTSAADTGEPLDLIDSVDGPETTVLEYRTGCEDGKVVDLWTLEGIGHLPIFSDAFADQVIPWLLERTR